VAAGALVWLGIGPGDNAARAEKPVDESSFVGGDTLAADGRVGKAIDVQGVVSVKPVMRRRWTPLARHMAIMPGDWVRTDVRGANAVAIQLAARAKVTLGPGSLVEVVKPTQLRLLQGELKVTADRQRPVELLGPNEQKTAVAGEGFYRLQKEELVRL
jgi:hypothetical protein